MFLLISTTASISTPFYFEQYVVLPSGGTIFPDLMYGMQGRPIDYIRVAIEGSVVISVAGLVVYGLHRFACVMTWIRSLTFVGVAGFYFVCVCLLPGLSGMMFLEVDELRGIRVIEELAPVMAMASPIIVIMNLFNEMGGRFPRGMSTAPFYLVHAVLLGLTIYGIRRRGPKLRELYLKEPARETDE